MTGPVVLLFGLGAIGLILDAVAISRLGRELAGVDARLLVLELRDDELLLGETARLRHDVTGKSDR